MAKIRSYNSRMDRGGVEELERRCEVGPKEHAFLFIDTLGDPLCRIRNSPQFNMLLAEIGNEIVGVIRGTIKMVTLKKSPKNPVKVGYILGLRVAPNHRRKGIGASLVRHVEDWFVSCHVDYSYMATEKDNVASLKLFVLKFGYVRFRTPSILVHPRTARSTPPRSSVQISRIGVEYAELLYRHFVGPSSDLFPLDIDRILRNRLSLGTWIACFRGDTCQDSWGLSQRDLQSLPKNWAMLSVWNSGEIFNLGVGQQTLSCSLYETMAKLLNNVIPCLKPAPLLPDLVGPFGFYFVYGVHREGPRSSKLLRALWKFVCNDSCDFTPKPSANNKSSNSVKLVITEVGCSDHELKRDIPHWRMLSCPEDLWCIKGLKNNNNVNGEKESMNELTNPKGALFVDPREV